MSKETHGASVEPQPASGNEAEVVSDVTEVKRFAKGHRKTAAETGLNAGPSLQGHPCHGRDNSWAIISREEMPNFDAQRALVRHPLTESLGQPWEARAGQEHNSCLIY